MKEHSASTNRNDPQQDFPSVVDWCSHLEYDESSKKYVITATKTEMRQLEVDLRWKHSLPPHERGGEKFALRMGKRIRQANGKFLRDETGCHHVVIGAGRIPIDLASLEMKSFLLETCNITTVSKEAASAVERLRVQAHNSSSKTTFRRFSAMCDGPEPKVYIPISTSGNLLCITQKQIELVPNGDNQDHLWLEHPEGNPMKWNGVPSAEQVRDGLALFEKLLVQTQACVSPSMGWFVAMAEGLFPLVRDIARNRFITLHIGRQGSGKTTGAKSFRLLHGFEDVVLDVTVAGLSSLPEQGLMVIDNKEQSDLAPSLVNHLLSVATGGQRIRASSDGSSVRRNAPHPVVVITSIEGVHKAELHDRCVEVKYFLAEGHSRLDRDKLERDIIAARDQIMPALAIVIQEYLSVRCDPSVHIGENPIDRFNGHFRELCYLLMAYGRLTLGEAGDAWAMEHIKVWDSEIRQVREGEDCETVSALETPILRVLRTAGCECKVHQKFHHKAQLGTLYVVLPGELLAALSLQRIPGLTLPKEAGGMGKRLRNDRFEQFEVLTANSGDEKVSAMLNRSRHGKPVGIFVADEGGQTIAEVNTPSEGDEAAA